MNNEDLRNSRGWRVLSEVLQASRAIDQQQIMMYSEFWNSYRRSIRLLQAVAKGGHVN